MERIIGRTSSYEQQSAARTPSSSLPEETLADKPASDAVPKESMTIQSASSSRRDVLPVDIEKADVSDIPEIQKFIDSLDRDTYQKRFGPLEDEEDFEKDRQFTKEHYLKTCFNDSETDGVLIARHDGQMVGMANFEDVSNEFNGCRVGDVGRVVMREFQGQGVGNQLLEKAHSFFRQQGIKYTATLVYTNNAVQMGQLLKNGWKEMTYSQQAVLSAALQDADVGEREFWMALDPSCKDIEPQRKFD